MFLFPLLHLSPIRHEGSLQQRQRDLVLGLERQVHTTLPSPEDISGFVLRKLCRCGITFRGLRMRSLARGFHRSRMMEAMINWLGSGILPACPSACPSLRPSIQGARSPFPHSRVLGRVCARTYTYTRTYTTTYFIYSQNVSIPFQSSRASFTLSAAPSRVASSQKLFLASGARGSM